MKELKKESKFNKGEWSEFYTFLKILADRKIHAADDNLEKIENIFYPILQILRKENDIDLIYDISDEQSIKIISGTKIIQVDPSSIKSSVKTIFDQITNLSKESPIPKDAKSIMELLHYRSMKAEKEEKADIKVVIHDNITLRDSRVGFSIKSYVGSKPTLLNSSNPTNFVYEIKVSEDKAKELLTLKGPRAVVKSIIASKGSINFIEVPNRIFEKNLRKIDSMMPVILSEFLVSYFGGQGSSVKELTSIVAKSDSIKNLDLDFNEDDIEFKIKHLLINVALGMVPATPWNGFLKADGGFIAIKKNGDMVCYHIYNIAQLSEYLFNNTKLETASTGKHKFGEIYSKNGKYYINLNLQIRFE